MAYRVPMQKEIDAYIKWSADLAQKYESEFYNSITIAQAIHEPYWGQSVLARDYNNFFGYKAKNGEWSGKTKRYESGEEDADGNKYQEVSTFRWYDDADELFKDHANMMVRTDWYRDHYADAINAKTPKEQAKALSRTYATDSSYGEKLIAYMDKYDLYQYDTPKKESNKMAYIGLDIGHGANTWETGGGKGVSTGGKVYEEHTFNSIVARKLKSLLEATGHKVTYRTQQPMANEVSLKSRTDRLKAEKVDIMVSIHANWIGSFKNSTNGIAAFYAGYSTGARQTNSKRLADHIMTAYRGQGQDIYHGEAVRSYVCSWTNFHMTREVDMPTVLMELGFMSGTRDFDKIFGSQQDKYTTQMAQGLADGINKYFGVVSKPFDTNNPQNMKTTPMKPYKAPAQEFSALKI